MKQLFLIFILCFSIIIKNTGQCNRSIDSLALVSIYNSCLGISWNNSSNWLVAGQNISTWYGVKLNNSGCVESLILPSNKLNGSLPPEIGDLKNLKFLNLTNNNLSGNLPSQMGLMTSLIELNLNTNKINGPIPAGFGNLTNLTKLLLSLNNFSGNIPTSLGNLSELIILHLHQNNFNGPIPTSIGNLNNLEELLLSQNNLIGTIPLELGNMTKLKSLILSQNKLTGAIPNSLGQLNNLFSFFADENLLSGTLPTEFGKMTNLRELWLNKNLLSGTIPSELSACIKLQKLLLNDNNLTGIIPDSIGNLSDLVSLHLSNNMLSGPIPESIGNLKNLISLLIGNNKINGVLPANFGNLKSLINLNLQNNKLMGQIPENFGALINIKRLYCQDNQLEGCFPKSMQIFCSLSESANVSSGGYNFRGNPDLIFGGDFKRWCAGEGRVKAVIVSNSPLCEGSQLDLTATGGVSFLWSGPAGFMSNIQSPTIISIGNEQFGNYKVAIANEFKCRDTAIINVKAIGMVSISSNSPICEGVNIELKSSGGLTYQWSGPNGFSSTLQNPVISNSNSSMAGKYTVDIITSDCTIKKEVEIVFLVFGTISSNSPICEGDTLRLSASEGQNFLWTGPDGFNNSSKSPIIGSSTLIKSGRYTVLIEGGAGCLYSLFTDVEIKKKYVPILQELVSNICQSDEGILLPTIVDGINGKWLGNGINIINGLVYFFPDSLNGNQNITFEPVEDGRCVSFIEQNIFVNYIDVSASENSPSLNDFDNNGSIFVTTSANTSEIIFDYTGPVSGKLFGNSNEINIIGNLTSGHYFITARDANGCIDSTDVNVSYQKPFYFLPNIIHQKSTSENGFFYVKGSNILSYNMEIYNRWGNLIFSNDNLMINDISQSWNPEFTKSNQGVYVYVLTLFTSDGVKKLTGSVTVI